MNVAVPSPLDSSCNESKDPVRPVVGPGFVNDDLRTRDDENREAVASEPDFLLSALLGNGNLPPSGNLTTLCTGDKISTPPIDLSRSTQFTVQDPLSEARTKDASEDDWCVPSSHSNSHMSPHDYQDGTFGAESGFVSSSEESSANSVSVSQSSSSVSSHSSLTQSARTYEDATLTSNAGQTGEVEAFLGCNLTLRDGSVPNPILPVASTENDHDELNVVVMEEQSRYPVSVTHPFDQNFSQRYPYSPLHQSFPSSNDNDHRGMDNNDHDQNDHLNIDDEDDEFDATLLLAAMAAEDEDNENADGNLALMMMSDHLEEPGVYVLGAASAMTPTPVASTTPSTSQERPLLMPLMAPTSGALPLPPALRLSRSPPSGSIVLPKSSLPVSKSVKASLMTTAAKNVSTTTATTIPSALSRKPPPLSASGCKTKRENNGNKVKKDIPKTARDQGCSKTLPPMSISLSTSPTVLPKAVVHTLPSAIQPFVSALVVPATVTTSNAPQNDNNPSVKPSSSHFPSSSEDFITAKALAVGDELCPVAATTARGVASDDRTGRWMSEEHDLFLQGLQRYGKQWKLIAAVIGTRTVVQVRTHAQKYFQKLERSTGTTQAEVMASVAQSTSSGSALINSDTNESDPLTTVSIPYLLSTKPSPTVSNTIATSGVGSIAIAATVQPKKKALSSSSSKLTGNKRRSESVSIAGETPVSIVASMGITTSVQPKSPEKPKLPKKKKAKTTLSTIAPNGATADTTSKCKTTNVMGTAMPSFVAPLVSHKKKTTSTTIASTTVANSKRTSPLKITKPSTLLASNSTSVSLVSEGTTSPVSHFAEMQFSEFHQKLTNGNTLMSSMLSSDGWNGVSPTGVSDFDFVFPEPSKIMTSSHHPMDLANFLDEDDVGINHDHMDPSDVLLAEDPLEWLIDGGMNHLPDNNVLLVSSSSSQFQGGLCMGESSGPPLFPDFKNDYLTEEFHLVPTKLSPNVDAICSSSHITPPDTPLTQTEMALSNMADLSVTVESLMR